VEAESFAAEMVVVVARELMALDKMWAQRERMLEALKAVVIENKGTDEKRVQKQKQETHKDYWALCPMLQRWKGEIDDEQDWFAEAGVLPCHQMSAASLAGILTQMSCAKEQI